MISFVLRAVFHRIWSYVTKLLSCNLPERCVIHKTGSFWIPLATPPQLTQRAGIKSRPPRRCGHSARSLHGGITDSVRGGDAGEKQTGFRMVYSAALPLGNAVPVLSEEVMIGKYFPQLASPGQRLNPSRRGSVESCDERDTTTPGKFLGWLTPPYRNLTSSVCGWSEWTAALMF